MREIRLDCFVELCGRSTKGNSSLGFPCALVDLFLRMITGILFIAGACFFWMGWSDGVVTYSTGITSVANAWNRTSRSVFKLGV